MARRASPSPPRWGWFGVLPALGFALAVGFVAWSLARLEISVPEMIEYAPYLADMLGQMIPPSGERLTPLATQLLVTFQMALVGCLLGVLLSIPAAFLAASNHSPHSLVYHLTRAVIVMIRSVPELIWALLFIGWVGLGPFAGVLAVVIDTLGFCGRFFAESLEEVDPNPGEALSAMGASSVSRFSCATLPAALPGMTNAGLYGVEKAVRSSVVLGLVGAGGIGVELSTSMEFQRYDQAATIILLIFAMVFAVERVSAHVRRRLL